MNILFLFTIGPVQPFIENSRKARDMYGGSKLLSETMDQAVSWMKQQECGEVIVPLDRKRERKGASDIPNRMIVRFPYVQKSALAEMAERLTDVVKTYFLNRCMALLERAGISGSGLAMARSQLEGFLEVYWLYESYGEGNYNEAYRKLFSGIQAVKGIRAFTQTMEPWGRKCALFPEYNAIFAKQSNDGRYEQKNLNRDYVWALPDTDRLRYGVKQREALSAIALVKRMYDKPETELYSVRLMVLKNRVEGRVFHELGIKPDDYLANALYDKLNGNIPLEEEYPPESVKAAALLYQRLEKEEIRLSSYYALMKFDGDDMGKNFLKHNTEEEQRQISENIASFAEKVPGIIMNHNGLPVYAGGEDFFGYLPLDHLFDCMSKLRQTFQQELQKGFEAPLGLTFSAGVVVAHVMEPLKTVIRMADQMERTAKNLEGKNAFAIGIIKRSGETTRMPAYKMESGCGIPSLSDVQKLLYQIKKSECSKSLLFHISQLFGQFAEEGCKPDLGMAEVLIKERVIHSAADFSGVNPDDLAQDLVLFYKANQDLKGFLDTLNGICFLAREVE